MKEETLAKMASDPGEFRRYLVIDEKGRRLGDVVEHWQRADFEAMDAALLEAAGRKEFDASTVRYMWSERPRGHSKTADAAVMCLWFLLFAKGPFPVIVGASDRDQGKLLLDSLGRLVRFNPWIDRVVSVNKFDATGRNGSRLTVISADVGSSFGATPRLIVADEVSHWPQATGEELWGSLFSSAGKTRECTLVSISNAGHVGTWQHSLRERVQDNPSWRFSHLDGPKASWISPRMLAQQEGAITPKMFERLWLNRWTDMTGDAIDGELIESALRGQIEPIEEAKPGFVYAAGLDLGLTSDATGLAIIGRHLGSRRLRLAKVMTWIPTKARPVKIEEVEQEMRRLCRAFNLRKVYVDDWQSRQMVERMRRDGFPIEGVGVNVAMYGRMARSVLSIFGDGMIELYGHVGLLRDLRAVSLVERPPGNIRLELPKTDSGHCDAAMGLFLAIEAIQSVRETVTQTCFRPFVVKRY